MISAMSARIGQPRKPHRAGLVVLLAAFLASSWTPITLPSTGPDLNRVMLRRGDIELRGMGPRGITAQDLNEDEVLDLVVANLGHETVPGSQTLDVFFGRGDGTFTLVQSIPSESVDMPYGVAVADLRGIGACDIIVPNKCSRTVSVYLGKPDGTFEPARLFFASDTWSVTAGDIDGDRRIDLAVANFDTFAISLLRGNGDGTFQQAEKMAATAGMQPRNVDFGDFDEDGRIDMVVPSDTLDGRVAIFKNTSAPGRFSFSAPQIIHLGLYTGATLVHDINNDDRLDIFASSLYSNHVSVLLGNGDLTFSRPVSYATGDIWPFGMVLSDIDGDGNPDIVTAGVKGITNSVLLGDGRGGFSAPLHFEIEGPSRVLAPGDFNGDGGMDIAIGNYTVTGRFDAEPHQFFRTVSIMKNMAGAAGDRAIAFRANCGGPSLTSSRGIPYAGDSNFDGGKILTTSTAITGTDDPALYQSAREGDFSYTARVRPGRSYTVKLHFAEISRKKKKRVFNVSINDKVALKGFNILTRVQPDTATTVVLRDVWPDQQGNIRIDFGGGKRGGICSAISIF